MARATTTTLARDLAMAADPVAMAREMGFEPYDWAKAALRSPEPRECWVVTRQGSKSTTASIMALHLALWQPRRTVLMLSPGQRQSGELFRKSLQSYRLLGRPVAPVSEAQTSLELGNGSRIVSLPGTEATVRSYSADLILVDEAARVPDDVWDAIRPMVAVTGGRIVLLSTPWLSEGFFYRAAVGEDPGWRVRTVTCDQIPTISSEFLEAELESMGRSVFDREYRCDFMSAGAGLFTMAQLRGLVDRGFCAPYPSEEA